MPMPDNPYDGYTLYEALEQTEIKSGVRPEMAFVDKGYKGVSVEGIQIWRPSQKCGLTHSLKAMIKRRSAIEPMIGHMKSDGKLGRNWLKGEAWWRHSCHPLWGRTQHSHDPQKVEAFLCRISIHLEAMDFQINPG